MNMRKTSLCGVCCLLFSCIFLTTVTADIEFDELPSIEDLNENRSDLELSLEDIDSNLLEAAIQSRPATRESSPSDILELLYTQTHLNRILKCDLYCWTYPLPTRNIITYPSILNFTPRQSQAGFSFFYQQTTNMFPWCSNIGGYINLFDLSLMREIDLEIARERNIDIPKTISLFKNARVEQRRVGFLFDLWKKYKRFNFGLELPFYAVERNYNLPEEDILEIKSSDVFESSDNPEAEEKAIHQYVLETRIGLGDLRLSLGFDAINTDCCRIVLGTKLTFPTSTTFASGFIGSDFMKKVQRCYLNLETLIENFTSDNQQLKDQAAADATCFGIKGVNQLGALLLATQLGENKRFQIAGYIEPTIRIDDQVTVFGSFRANWMEPKYVSRFILENVACSLFDDSNFDINLFPEDQKEQLSEQALLFLNNRLQNWIFPCCYRVKLRAQEEYQFIVAALINFTGNWKVTLGYDFWYKKGESACIVQQNGSIINQNRIKLDRALQPYTSQNKIFLKFEYAKFKESHNFLFSFGADLPLVSTNIGDDYTGFLKFEWIF